MEWLDRGCTKFDQERRIGQREIHEGDVREPIKNPEKKGEIMSDLRTRKRKVWGKERGRDRNGKNIIHVLERKGEEV